MFPSECAPSRRHFLMTAAAFTTGVSGLTLLSQPALSEDADVNIIGPKKGYSPQIGTLVSMMMWMRMVLLMSVNPGFAGQQFIPGVLPKIAEVRRRVRAGGRAVRIEVDGGIKVDNIASAAAAGADTFVAGSAIFGSEDYVATIRALRAALAGSGVPV